MRTSSLSLRSRFLAALAAGGALAGVGLGACGGSVDSPIAGASSSSGASGASPTPTGTTGSTSGGFPAPTTGSSGGPPPKVEAGTVKDVGVDTNSGVCSWSKPVVTCYTHAQLEYQWSNPPQGGDVGMDAGPPPWDPDGCLPAQYVQDGCCNTAVAGPVFNGTQCCYQHCTGACCGRPFIVDGHARVANVIERDGWTSSCSDDQKLVVTADHHEQDLLLDAFTRERIATAWSNDAAMEHASVAAFARFTLELLELGAPADLLLLSQEATRDEIEHARACFTIASGYAGRTLGPSNLRVGSSNASSAAARSLAEVAASAVAEGCVGETLSAVLAEARAARCEDPASRGALETIAADEARHAELAWRFVGWAIAVGGDDVRDAVSSAMVAAYENAPNAFDEALRGVPAKTLRTHGLLDENAARSLVEVAMRDVVGPCADVMTLQAA